MSQGCMYDHDEKSAARILGVSARTLRAWRKGGKIGYYRTPGGRVRYSVEQLIDVQRAGGVPAANGRTLPHSAAQR